MGIIAIVIGLVALSGVVYVVARNTQKPVTPEGTTTVEAEADIVEAEVQAIESRPGYTTRRRVEVLKSNEQGDPNANRYDFVEGEASGEAEIESTVQGDPDANRYDFGTGYEAIPGAYETETTESSNELDDNCGSETGADSNCDTIDQDDDGDSIPAAEAKSETNQTDGQEAAATENPVSEAN